MFEIGSEFWNSNPKEDNVCYFLSGRTALEYIIRDILLTRTVNSALLPAFCCESVIEPFVRNNIDVRFYQVHFDNKLGFTFDIPKAQSNEIFFFMKYFGFEKIDLEPSYINQWDVIIEDKTHSYLSNVENEEIEVDYSFTSFRKWTGLTGIANAIKYKNVFVCDREQKNLFKYDSIRKEASKLKEEYILKKDTDKKKYLRLFEQAEEILESDYVGCIPNHETFEKFLNVDWDFVSHKRRENAKFLISGLKRIKDIELPYDRVEENDVPLFVPIVVKGGKRDELRRHLINNNIYCPIHWPISELHKNVDLQSQQLYSNILSLVCDQRYNIDDMDNQITVISKYFSSR